MDLDPLLLSRLQFAWTIGYHILWPTFPSRSASRRIGNSMALNRRTPYNPRRFWLHTCTKDHPAALPNYLKAGFAIDREEVKDQE